ncbi:MULTISPECIES: hypothetical protein [Streptomyces]|uniref:hypothetical protein n=1 Tax=Streptomyces TaxID=1883 RepID=UPI00331A9BA7
MSPEDNPVPPSLRAVAAADVPPASPVSSPGGEGSKRLNGAEAAMMTVVFATAVVLYLTGSTFGEVMRMVAAVGGLAAVILASATGRIPVRAWIRKLGRLAGEE